MQTILLLLLIYPIMICLSFTSSLGARLFIAVVDALVPDPVPFADEILTCTGVVVKIIKIRYLLRLLNTILKVGLIILGMIVIGMLITYMVS